MTLEMLGQCAGVAPAVWGLSFPRYDCITVFAAAASTAA